MKITNPFLQGPYEPLRNECTIENVDVLGTIPLELTGTLYRSAPSAEFLLDDPNRFHWFDGDGMVHAFRIENGRASYRNCWVETEGLKVERSAGRQLYNGIYGRSEAPQKPLPEGAPEIKTVAGINVIRLGTHLLAMHEAEGHYWEIDPVTLKTLGTFDFDGQVSGMLTAHPHFDPATKEWIFYSLDNEKRSLTCFTADIHGAVTSKFAIPMSFTPWNHDVIFTAEHFIFFFGMISWRPYAEDRIPQGKSSWFIDPAAGTDARILFVHRKTGEALWIEPENSPYMIGHFLNAYQDGDKTIVDASATPVSGALKTFNPEDFYPFPLVPGPAAFENPQLWRFVINPHEGTVEHHRIGDFSAEFVRPNETIMGQKHRYGYMAGAHDLRPETRGFNCLVKHDYEGNVTRFQHLSPDYDMTPGEPVFVPHPDGETEDHGWVLAVWYDPRRNASELVILDAQKFDGEPVARIRLDHHVPLGFHGNWIADC
ncbi:carotenoid oxygenase family protein [Acetobacter conturbans]|uniref:Dioxygenase n=1 Tax=Acetobacter conturbans TaxID=1737472 RepID=A0ABX0K4H4_9PROT|nr:carotenoid oxygenase family protein [Acetobacter conturbans]NHN89515.1 carotenoid oxygenase [Acetobacter conturbans]